MIRNIAIGAWIACSFGCAQCHADAIFALSNSGYGLTVLAPVYDADGHLLAGNQYMAQLYAGSDQNSLTPLSPSAPFLTGALAGYLQSTLITDRSGNFLKNSEYFVQLRVWDTSLGSTWQIAASKGLGGVGESSTGREQTGGSGGVPSLPSGLSGLHSFSLSPLVPEPSTYALIGVGGAMLWWQSRRKSA